jgi:anti-sigma factor RsiW
MELETQLSIQALIDGELSDAKQREVEQLIATDAGAKALHTELSNTVGALRGGELERQLPESREFFWSKIADEIELSERREARAQARPAASVALWKRLLLPFAAAAALVLAFTVFQNEGPQVVRPINDNPGVESVADTELELPESLIFDMYQEDATVIWVNSETGVN